MAFSLLNELKVRGFDLTEDMQRQFERYFNLLIDWNERINLTAITDRDGVFEKHFFDSITPIFYEDFSIITHVVDIGAGAGFPSLPIKILYPHLEVTIIDSLNKRILFLQELSKELGLQGVKAIHGRAEELAQKNEHREKYPVVLARAVARLPVLAELCLPFTKVDGKFIALKGSHGEEEIKESQKALETLGGKLERNVQLTLPTEEAQRMLIWIAKVKSTPKQYPRKPGTPNKSPI